MAVYRDHPYAGVNFSVDIGDGQTEGPQAGLLEVIFPEARLQTQEYRSGNAKTNEPIKIRTLTEYSNLILTRGVSGSLNWYQWWNEVRNGVAGTSRTVVVRLLSEDLSEVVLTWKFVRAHPVNLEFSALDALGEEMLTETLELAFERFEME